jgi:type I restriction enzyme S subunit
MTLPHGWVETTIGEVADTKLGKMLDANKNKGEPVAYLRNVNVRWGAFDLSDVLEMRVTPDEREALSVRNGDLFMCEGGEPGRCAVWRAGERDLVFQKAIHRVRPLDAVEADYLATYIAHLAAEDGLSHLFTGTTIKHLPQVALQRITLLLPPAAEQRRIIAKLDAVTIRLARARADLERVMILARRLRSEVLSRCLSKHEAATPLGDLLTGIEAGKNLRCEERPPRLGERGVVKVSAVTWGRFDAQQSKTLPHDYTPPDAAKIRAGDLLISRANTLELVGATVLVEKEPNELYLSDKILRLVMPDADKRWVMWFLRSQAGRREIELRSTGNQLSMRNISQGALRDIPIPYPDADVRKAGVEMIESAFARADRLEAEATRARALLDRLEAAILVKAFRGQLVPQDPNDEPASVLLDRIRAERAAAPKPKRGRARKAVG